MPNDLTRPINLDDAVVELIGDENVSRLVKFTLSALGTRDPASA
jgi:hypothetical protein